MPGETPNGEGTSFSISLAFNPNSDADVRAYETARRLAMPHGRRKAIFISMLLAIDEWEKANNKEFTAEMVAGLFMLGVSRPASTFREPLDVPEQGVRIRTGASTGVSAETTVNNFFEGMDDDDLFGDF